MGYKIIGNLSVVILNFCSLHDNLWVAFNFLVSSDIGKKDECWQRIRNSSVFEGNGRKYLAVP